MPSMRDKVTRLAATFPKGSTERKALLRVLSSTALDADVLDTLRRIHEARQVEHYQEQDVIQAYHMLDNDGDGFEVGEIADDISDIQNVGRLIDTVKSQVAVYWQPRKLILVGDKSGPWAVQLQF